jgi:hypothetical protein
MMRKLSLFALVLCAASCKSGGTPPAPQPITQPAARPAAPPTAPPQTSAPGAGNAATAPAAPVDTNPALNGQVQNQLRAIAGRENEPATAVFKNVQVLKSLTAGQFLRMMGSFTRATGGRCSTCHVAGDWPNETKPQKQVARQMVEMVEVVNTRIKGIQGIRGQDARVGCFTCHRGLAQPAP